MRYAIINRERCRQLGINPLYRKQIGDDVVITEKELDFSAAQGDTVDDKAESEGLELMEIGEVQDYARKQECNDNDTNENK